jgi:hypothetical protein
MKIVLVLLAATIAFTMPPARAATKGERESFNKGVDVGVCVGMQLTLNTLLNSKGLRHDTPRERMDLATEIGAACVLAPKAMTRNANESLGTLISSN